MKRPLLLFLLVQFLFSSLSFSSAIDSLRVSICTWSGDECYGFPVTSKEIQHFDSAGSLSLLEGYLMNGCTNPNDTGFANTFNKNYEYDSLGRLLSELNTQFRFDSVSVILNYSYRYDTAGNRIVYKVEQFYPLPVITFNQDSFAFNYYGNKIYELNEFRNSQTGLQDTSLIQRWTYDSLDHLFEHTRYHYSGNTVQSIDHSYNIYDSLWNILNSISASIDIQTGSIDSSQTEYVYDSLSRKIQATTMGWDSAALGWQFWNRTVFVYDSLSQLFQSYSLYCQDTTCSDTTAMTSYTYDSAGRLTEKHYHSFIDEFGDGWDITYYDGNGNVIQTGYGYPTKNGCGYSQMMYFTFNSNQQLTHSVTETLGCSFSSATCDYFNLNEDSLLASISYPATACPFDTIQYVVHVYGGVPPYSYHWSPVINIFDSLSMRPKIIADTTIFYTLTVTDSVGLTQTSSALLNVHEKNIPAFSLSSFGSPCPGSSYLLTFNSIGFNPPWSLEWMLNGSTFFSNNDTITTSGSGVYSAVAIDVNGCRVTSDPFPVQLFVGDTVSVVSSGSSSICSGESVTLEANSPVAFSWNTGDSTQFIVVNTAGDYFAVSTDSFGCVDTSNVLHFQVYALPSVNLGNDTIVCVNDTLLLNAGAGYVQYLWQDGNSLENYSVFSAGVDTLNFFVQVTDTNTCMGSDSIQVIVDICTGIIQRAINPNCHLFPNPVRENLFIDQLPSSNCLIRIFSHDGRECFSEYTNSRMKLSLNTSQYSNGLYLISIQDEKGNVMKNVFLKE